MEEQNEAFVEALLTLNRLAARRIVAEASGALPPLEIAEGLIAGSLDWIGREWQKGNVALSQVYMSGRICEELMNDLLPPGAPDRKNMPPLAIATLEDYHLLGKKIVFSVLRAEGFDLKDYGRVTVDEAAQRAGEDRIAVLLISTLMLPSALHVRDLVARLKSAGKGTKVVVGGAPFLFDPALWREVGADAMGRSASEAAGIIERISGGES